MQKNIMHDTLSVFDSSFKHQSMVLDVAKYTHGALQYCSRPYYNNCLVFAIVLAIPCT